MADESDMRFVNGATEIYWCGNWVLKGHLPKDWCQRSEDYRLAQRIEQDLQDRHIELKAFAQWLDRQKENERLNARKRQAFQVLISELKTL